MRRVPLQLSACYRLGGDTLGSDCVSNAHPPMWRPRHCAASACRRTRSRAERLRRHGGRHESKCVDSGSLSMYKCCLASSQAASVTMCSCRQYQQQSSDEMHGRRQVSLTSNPQIPGCWSGAATTVIDYEQSAGHWLRMRAVARRRNPHVRADLTTMHGMSTRETSLYTALKFAEPHTARTGVRLNIGPSDATAGVQQQRNSILLVTAREACAQHANAKM